MQGTGLLLVVSGPSGAGKSTVCERLKQKHSDMALSISATTRAPRHTECEGVNYYFKTDEQFDEMIRSDELLEYAQIYGNRYGTPSFYVNEQVSQGRDVLLEIEMQGALQVKGKRPDGVFIFVVPPDMYELRERIIGRGSETPETLRERFFSAYTELQYWDHYDYIVVNDDLESAVGRIEAIMAAERCRAERNKEMYKKLLHQGLQVQQGDKSQTQDISMQGV